MKSLMEKLEHLLELGGTKKDITLLAISGIAVLLSLFGVRPFPFDMAWIAVILCGIPIILEAVIGLVTAFDIKADVLVSLALIASVAIGEDFAAGEVACLLYTSRLAAGQHLKGLLYLMLVLRVSKGGGLVQHHNGGVLQNGPGQGNACLLYTSSIP